MTDENKYIEESFRNEEYAKESLETTKDCWIEEIKTSFLIIRSEPGCVGQQGKMSTWRGHVKHENICLDNQKKEIW